MITVKAVQDTSDGVAHLAVLDDETEVLKVTVPATHTAYQAIHAIAGALNDSTVFAPPAPIAAPTKKSVAPPKDAA